MKSVELPPFASSLIQSLRAVGYTTPAALADLVDNSIAASSRHVAIRFRAQLDPYIAIIDDGEGMDDTALLAAMRFGSRDPREVRTGLDLGRFGLGLKTASLSQGRRLTVASLRFGTLSIAAWDVDFCERQDGWWLERPSVDAIPAEVLELLTGQQNGTAVIWQHLDRLTATGGLSPARAIEIAMDESADHLAMVFHRFLAGEMGFTFDITVNGRPLPRLNPFLEGHTRGQALHSETFRIEGWPVTVSPFVLPFPSRLKPAELDRAGGRDSLRGSHGFYVYRGGRLVVPGGWFRIVPSDELIRLARVRVDVPVELDHLWKVDIRKTIAEPPAALRPHLKRIVGDVTLRSRRVYTHKGSPKAEAERVPLWQRHELREGAAAWKVNREHPVVMALAATGSVQEKLLSLLEESLPIHDIHLHVANDLPVGGESGVTEVDLEQLAQRMVDAFQDRPDMMQRILERLPSTDPFNRDPQMTRRIVEKLQR